MNRITLHYILASISVPNDHLIVQCSQLGGVKMADKKNVVCSISAQEQQELKTPV